MSRTRRNRPNAFDARSVVLFAAIAVSGLGAHAQSPTQKSGAKTSASASRSQGASPRTPPSPAAQRAVFGGTAASSGAPAVKAAPAAGAGG